MAEAPVVNGEEGLQLTEKQLKKAAKKEAKKAKFEKKMENKTLTSVISIFVVVINYFFTKKTESKAAKKKGNKEVLTYDIPTPKGEKKGTCDISGMGWGWGFHNIIMCMGPWILNI